MGEFGPFHGGGDMTESILYTRNGHVGRLLLNNPERHNSLGEEQLSGIRHHVETMVGAEAPRVLVITGAGGRTFCSGASLGELNSGRISGDLFQQTTDLIAALPFPTIAAINGNVFGGGVELALSCDFRVGIEGARMRVPAAAIGLCYPVSGIQRFVQRLGVPAAKRLLMAAEEVKGQGMVEIGFLDYMVAREALDQTVDELAGRLSALAPLAVRAMKDIIQQAAAGNLQQEQAGALAQACQDSGDLQEGFAAQRDKRRPEFKGR